MFDMAVYVAMAVVQIEFAARYHTRRIRALLVALARNAVMRRHTGQEWRRDSYSSAPESRK
jgi:hypothetical protein